MVKRFGLNLIVIFVSIAGAAFFARLLYVDIYVNTSQTDGLDQAGVIKEKSETVRRKLADNLVWDMLKSNDKLFWDDSIQTGVNAQAVLSLKTGGEIKLGESSLVILSKDNDELSLHLKSGQIVVDSSQTDKEGTIKVNGLALQSGKGKTLAMQVDQKKGSLTATSINSDGTGKQYTIDQSGKVEEKEIPISLESPGPMAKHTTPEDKYLAQFKWRAPKNKSVLFEIAKDRDFNSVIKKQTTSELQVESELAPGKYYWRVTDLSNGSTATSEVRGLRILRVKAPILLSPTSKKSVVYKKEIPLVEFSWSKLDGAESYLLEVAKDEAFESLVLKEETTTTGFKTSRLEDGELFWRVTSVYGSQDSERKPSSISEIEIKKSLETSPPQLLSPGPEDKIDHESFNKQGGIPFAWSTEDSEVYKFVLSKTSDLTEEVVSLETQEKQTVFKKMVEPGTYYWSVGFKNQDGQWNYKDIKTIRILPLTPLLPAPSYSQFKLLYNIASDKEKRAEVQWQEVPGAQKYKFKIIGLDKKSLGYYHEGQTADREFEQKDLKVGQYKWVLTSVDQYGRESKPNEKIFKVIESRKLAPPEFEMQGVQ